VKLPHALDVFIGVIAVFVVGVILQELQSVLLPFVLALFFAILFKPLVMLLIRKRIPMAISLFVVLIAVALVLSLLALMLYSSTEAFVAAAPRYQARLSGLLASITEIVKEVASRYDITIEDIRSTDLFSISALPANIVSGVGTVFSALGTVFLIVLFMLFILSGTGDLGKKVAMAFPQEQAERISGIIRNINHQVRQYLVTKTLISAGTGLLVGLALWILGVDFPLLWGFLTFGLNFIPNFGSVVATALPCLLSLLQFDSFATTLLVMITLSFIQLVIGNVVEPRIMAFSLNLSALVILVSLIFWGWLWGIWGMVIAVPLTAIIKIVLENIDTLRPISVLMSGRIQSAG
jgi:AI-2 transport protein TqsA